MNPQEQQLLEDFLQRLAAARGVAKDVQADALIQQYLTGHPDALYLLVQRSLLQQQALDNAKAQIAQLQAQAQAGGQGGSSFLGGQSGGWSQPQPATPPPMPQQPQAAAPGWRERLFGAAPAPQQAAPQPAAAPGFLASAATTAAGVAGGMFLFNGIESLMGGHHGGGQETVVENVTQNNFYDDNNGHALQNDHAFAQDDSNDFNGDLSDVGDVGFDDDNDNSWA